MRMVFGVIALLVVAFVLLNLGKRQAEALQPRPAASGAAAGSAANLPQQVQQDVQQALEQGLQQRASEPSQ